MRFSPLLLVILGIPALAAGQTLPSEPVTFGGGRVVLGGDVAAGIAPEDEGFFTYSEYEHSTLRELRLGLNAQVHANRRLSVLAEVRSENLDDVTPFALYARFTPFPGRGVHVQAGRIPPAFGRFSRQAYSRSNPLIGYPLAYQYLTSLRPDALPATPQELATMRGRGWRSSFSVGNKAAAPGVPLAASTRWDTGIEVTAGWKAITGTAAVTAGTLSNPRVRDDNDGRSVSARLVIAAAPGVEIGSSFSRGAFVGRSAARELPAGAADDLVQEAYGLDVEYGYGHLLLRGEAVASGWRVPFAGAGTVDTLRALGTSVEGRYTIAPGVHVAARFDHLAFGRIASASGRIPWEADVTRVEVGGGYYIRRNVIARASFQINDRDTARNSRARLPAVQLLFWF